MTVSLRRRQALAVVMALFVTAAGAAEPKPSVDGPEGERAFRDLGSYYKDENHRPSFRDELDQLADPGSAIRKSAGRYLLALFKQSQEDEKSGRAEWQSDGSWGGTANSQAREFRQQLASAFGEKARGPEALETLLWLIEHESLPEGLDAAAKVLPRVDSPAMEKVIADLLAQPHPYAALAKAAIEEASRRKLAALAPRIRELCNHYRDDVREAARKAAQSLGIDDVPKFDPAAAFSPWLAEQLRAFREMVPVQVPPSAQWVAIERTRPRNLPLHVEHFSGWLVAKNAESYEVVTWYGTVVTLPKNETKCMPRKLTDTAIKIVRLQQPREGWMPEELSVGGNGTAQFEPRFVSAPAALVAAWCFERGEREAAAKLLFPCLNQAKDDRWVALAVRDMLGDRSHQRMLELFSYDRDDASALKLADHLSKPVFDGYRYQPRAQELAAQLRRRNEDFKTFKLPAKDKWDVERAGMPRAEQIKFLAGHLRLLNCFQSGQPGGVNYSDPQYVDHGERWNPKGGNEVPNPYVELLRMKLSIRDLLTLVPFLADEDFLPTFSYWRDFHPDRSLHRVRWLVANLVNEAAKRDLSQNEKMELLDEEGRKEQIASILGWCNKNADKSRGELLLETLRTSKESREFIRAASEALQNKVTGAADVIIKRKADIPDDADKIAQMLFRFGTPAALGAARQWVNDLEKETRFWSALILIRDGNRAEREGFVELTNTLSEDDGTSLYPQAIEPLLATKDEAAMQIATDILKKKGFSIDSMFVGDQVLHRLALTGRPEVLDYLTKGLADAAAEGNCEGEWHGRKVIRKHVRGDTLARSITGWGKDGTVFDGLAPDKERTKMRTELKRWLNEQFALIHAGKPSAISQPEPIPFTEWHLDAP